jgi:hypothetical protein
MKTKISLLDVVHDAAYEFDVNVDISIIHDEILKALQNKLPTTVRLLDNDKIIIPFDVLKNSLISITAEESKPVSHLRVVRDEDES